MPSANIPKITQTTRFAHSRVAEEQVRQDVDLRVLAGTAVVRLHAAQQLRGAGLAPAGGDVPPVAIRPLLRAVGIVQLKLGVAPGAAGRSWLEKTGQ